MAKTLHARDGLYSYNDPIYRIEYSTDGKNWQRLCGELCADDYGTYYSYNSALKEYNIHVNCSDGSIKYRIIELRISRKQVK